MLTGVSRRGAPVSAPTTRPRRVAVPSFPRRCGSRGDVCAESIDDHPIAAIRRTLYGTALFCRTRNPLPSEPLRRVHLQRDVHVLDGALAPDGENPTERARVARARAVAGRQNRIVVELHLAGVEPLGPVEDVEVNVRRDIARWVRPGADGLELEAAVRIGPRPAAQAPRVRRRSGTVVVPFAVRVVREHDSVRDHGAAISREETSVDDERRSGLPSRGDARARRQRRGTILLRAPERADELDILRPRTPRDEWSDRDGSRERCQKAPTCHATPRTAERVPWFVEPRYPALA